MSDQDTSKGTVLLVDDDPDNLGSLSEYLIIKGFTVLLSQDGKSAIEQAEAEQPDIILLDILMPEMDGFETCRRLKACDKTKDIPVIFLTALSEIIDEVKGFEVGGVDYITKPFRHETILTRVNAHLTIRNQQEQLQALNASKDKFFSIIAHDLRGPLNALLEATQLLEEHFENFSPDQIKRNIMLQRQSVDNLCKLLDNLLTWSKIQHGMLEYRPQLLDMKNVVAWNIQLLKPDAVQKQIVLRNSIQKETRIRVDLNMIDIVIRNLISNAIKFSRNGGYVDISAASKQDVVEVSISDTGIGIRPDKLPRLFQIDADYQRAGTAGERGTGLGLILCKEFVERNGGQIWCESEVGKGTTFRFTFPKALVE